MYIKSLHFLSNLYLTTKIARKIDKVGRYLYLFITKNINNTYSDVYDIQ